MSNLAALNRNSEFSLEQGSVAPLLNAADYEALYQAARALPQWSERTLKTVSECLLQWTADGLARPGNADNLRELVRLLQRLQVHKKPEATPALDVAGTYRVWDSLVTLIVIRLSALDAQQDTSIETRTHVRPLRRAVESLSEPKRASEIRAELRLSAPRMSQLLALVEEAGFITRTLEGREQWVMPTDRWKLPAPKLQPSSKTAAPAGRFAPGARGESLLVRVAA